MPNWRKVITSGSDAYLNSLNVTYGVTGSLLGTASYALQSLTSSFSHTASYVNILYQNVTISGSLNISGSISNVDAIQFNTASSVPLTVGGLQYDDGSGTLDILLKGGNIDLQIGQENVVLIHNGESTTLNKGEVVYVSGSVGNRPLVKRASAVNDGYSVTTLGFAAESITAGAEGYVTTFGMVNNLNTTASYEGAPVWLSGTIPGGWTTTKPQAPIHTVLLGYIVRVDNTVGSIFVHISNGWEIEELHNVRIVSDTDGDILVKSGSLWINSKQLTGSYGLTGSLSATSFTGSLFGTASWAQNAVTASHLIGLNVTLIGTGSVSASVDVASGSFTVNSGSTILFNVQNNGGVEIGLYTTASGIWSHAEGELTKANGNYSHTEGRSTTAGGNWSHAEGWSTSTIGFYTHAEGISTTAFSDGAHSEGNSTTAFGNNSHAEGDSTYSEAIASHAEGQSTRTVGNYSHAEGQSTRTIGNHSHAEGSGSISFGAHSHAEGINTIASGSGQLTVGHYNTKGNTTSLVVIGNGTSDSARSDLALFNPTNIIFNAPVSASSFTGSLFGTSSWAQNVVSASYALTASYVLNGGAIDTGSLLVTASAVSNTITFTKGNGTTFDVTVAGGGGITYGYNATASFTSQPTWVFNHNLGSQLVIVQAVDTNYNQIIPSSITLNGTNQATLTFPVSQSGYAIASLGGNPISASYALTASYALNGGGAPGAGFPYSGSAEITGSLNVIGPLTATIIYSPAINLFNYYNFI